MVRIGPWTLIQDVVRRRVVVLVVVVPARRAAAAGRLRGVRVALRVLSVFARPAPVVLRVCRVADRRRGRGGRLAPAGVRVRVDAWIRQICWQTGWSSNLLYFWLSHTKYLADFILAVPFWTSILRVLYQLCKIFCPIYYLAYTFIWSRFMTAIKLFQCSSLLVSMQIRS